MCNGLHSDFVFFVHVFYDLSFLYPLHGSFFSSFFFSLCFLSFLYTLAALHLNRAQPFDRWIAPFRRHVLSALNIRCYIPSSQIPAALRSKGLTV